MTIREFLSNPSVFIGQTAVVSGPCTSFDGQIWLRDDPADPGHLPGRVLIGRSREDAARRLIPAVTGFCALDNPNDQRFALEVCGVVGRPTEDGFVCTIGPLEWARQYYPYIRNVELDVDWPPYIIQYAYQSDPPGPGLGTPIESVLSDPIGYLGIHFTMEAILAVPFQDRPLDGGWLICTASNIDKPQQRILVSARRFGELVNRAEAEEYRIEGNRGQLRYVRATGTLARGPEEALVLMNVTELITKRNKTASSSLRFRWDENGEPY